MDLSQSVHGQTGDGFGGALASKSAEEEMTARGRVCERPLSHICGQVTIVGYG